MRLSFPTNPPPPRKDLALVLAVSLAIAAAALPAVEGRWAKDGYRPSVVDTKDLWSYHRSRVYAGRQNHVALLGTSLIQFGFSLEVYREAYPDRPITQLAISAQYPMATLRDLARDPDFCGIALVEVHEGAFARETWDHQAEFVTHYHERYPAYHELECPVVSALQERFAILNHHYPLDTLLAHLVRGGPGPPPSFMTMRADRSCRADYVDLPANYRFRLRDQQLARAEEERPPPPEVWLDDVSGVDEWVQDIHGRGGRVVFIRFPAGGPIAETDERLYPRSQYWARLEERCSAILLDGRNVPALADIRLPDMLHLDQRDSPAFTRALLGELVRLDVLPPSRAARR